MPFYVMVMATTLYCDVNKQQILPPLTYHNISFSLYPRLYYIHHTKLLEWIIFALLYSLRGIYPYRIVDETWRENFFLFLSACYIYHIYIHSVDSMEMYSISEPWAWNVEYWVFAMIRKSIACFSFWANPSGLFSTSTPINVLD